MKYVDGSLVGSTGILLLALVLLAAPMVCQLMPCCLPTSECCDNCRDEGQSESTIPVPADCSSGHCLNATLSLVTQLYVEEVSFDAAVTTPQWIDSYIPEDCSDPLYRPPITTC